MLADPRADALVSNFVGQWLFLQKSSDGGARSAERSRFRRRPAPGIPPRNGAFRREHPPRGSQRSRPADRQLHVRERAAGAALRHSEHPRDSFPPRRSERPQPPRSAGPRQRARGHVVPESHVAGRARQVDSREPARHAGAAAAARCAGAEGRSRNPPRKSSRCASGSRSIAPTPRARAATR